MTDAVVEVQDLTKHFVVEPPLYKQLLAPFATKQKTLVLERVSFSIRPGEILGVVGPNGAGKTTLLRMLADLLEPDGGWIAICGQRLNKRKCHLRRHIGYVSSDERSFFWRLSGRQNLEFFARLYGVHRSEARRRIDALLEAFAVAGKADQLFLGYSTGIRKKFALIRAFVHQPPVVLLDEVTNSLDPYSAQSVKSLVRAYVCSRNGGAAVWSTHRQEEIAEICDKVLLIENGVIRFYGSAGNFQHNGAGDANTLSKRTRPNGKPAPLENTGAGTMKV
ncbi:MAG: ABC transporter ATP-binding protein [Planctomycetota bacterium]|jgi:ABC-2 type transport system ATP-binding protein